MDDPNITMEEYIQLMADKAQKHGRTFDWQNATFSKVKYYENEDDCFTNFEAMFPAIIFGNRMEDDDAISSRPTVGPPFETNPRTTMEECENAFGKDFETGFPAIVYNDASTSNQNVSSEPTIIIMESLVKKKQKGAILELKRRHLKNTIFCTYTPYPAMKIRRISASSAQETRNDQFPIRRIHYNQYAVCTAVHQSKIRI
ncbi:hypothetical protein Tco_0109807 [Tanacetum coccineum]